MKKKEGRFIKVSSDIHGLEGSEVLIDRETGVNYLFHYSGYAGGLTVLLGTDGKPVVSPLPVERD